MSESISSNGDKVKVLKVPTPKPEKLTVETVEAIIDPTLFKPLKPLSLTAEPAIKGRVATKWLVDNLYKIHKEDFYNEALSEDDLKAITRQYEFHGYLA